MAILRNVTGEHGGKDAERIKVPNVVISIRRGVINYGLLISVA